MPPAVKGRAKVTAVRADLVQRTLQMRHLITVDQPGLAMALHGQELWSDLVLGDAVHRTDAELQAMAEGTAELHGVPCLPPRTTLAE